MSETLCGIPGVVCMMDDVLVHGKTQQEHDQRLRERLQVAGVTLNAEKCQFSKKSVKFLGHAVDHTGICPDPDKVTAIWRVRTPGNVGDVRHFLGMVNQMSTFTPNLAEETQPVRALLVKDNEWVWGEPQQRSFDRIKELLMNAPVLALFDPNLETVLSADASSFGLGAVLLQRQPSGELKLVAFISRSMTPTEQGYARIEKEALAFTWACEQLSDYLIGLPFHVHMDHKPLVPLFSSKHLEELPIRVQCFRLRMMHFQFSISHVPGKDLITADALLHALVADPTSADEQLQQEANVFIKAILQSLPATDQRLEEIKQHQRDDDVCQQITAFCESGWPDKRSITASVYPYFPMSAEFSVVNGLLMRGNRKVIPPALRRELLSRIHTGHQGIIKCRERVRQSVWWPGSSNN